LGLRCELATERQLLALAQTLQRDPEQQLREAGASEYIGNNNPIDIWESIDIYDIWHAI
jgi:hypothetical protein